MTALFWALADRANFYRQVVRLGLIFVLVDFIVFFLAETMLVAATQTMLHPAISIFGFVWMALTAFSIWYFGGAPADMTLVAGMINRPTEKDKGITRLAKEICEPARLILRTVKFFFLFEGLITCYFLLVPIWAFWPAHFAMMVLLTVFIICGNLLHLEWPLLAFRKWTKAVMSALIICTFIMASYNFFTGQDMTVENVKNGAQSLEWKSSGKSCPTVTAKKVPGRTKTFRTQGGQVFPPVKLEPGQVTDTGIHYKAGDLLTFGQIGEPSRFYVVGSRGDREILTKNYSGRGLGPTDANTTIWLRGGEQPTTVAITVTKS